MLRGKPNKCKIFLIGILSLVIPQIVSAQGNFQSELSWGVNGGVSMSSVSFNPRIPQSKLRQGVGGLSARYISEKHFGIQCELNYSQRGWKEMYPDSVNRHYSRSLAYLELPVLTHIYFETGKRGRIIFNLGPQIGYFLSQKELESNIDKNKDKTPNYVMSIQNRFDWGLCFGGGFEFRTDIGNFILDGRYYFGLSDIFDNSKIVKNPETVAFNFAASSNQVICVKLTYLFKLKN